MNAKGIHIILILLFEASETKEKVLLANQTLI